ncbi:MAG: Gp15 family bacteriophage protein [Chloroflexota bacterium]
MNLLTEALPSAVEIGGQEWPLETDFRAALRVLMAFEDPELTGAERVGVLLANLYPEPPADLQRALALGMRFLDGDTPGSDEPGPRLFSFEKDGALIFAAFRQTHGIDLETAELHWWKFLALFMDLGADTAFCQLVGLRKRVKSGRATREERQAAREMGEAFVIAEPDRRSADERTQEAEFLRLVAEAQERRAQ